MLLEKQFNEVGLEVFETKSSVLFWVTDCNLGKIRPVAIKKSGSFHACEWFKIGTMAPKTCDLRDSTLPRVQAWAAR